MSKIKVRNLNLWYGNFHALKNIQADFVEKEITAIIGPSGCGKSTMLRVLNRINDLIEGVKISGEVYLSGFRNVTNTQDINTLGPKTDLMDLRKRVGMVFQRPNPFPLSIYENIVFGPRVHGQYSREELDEIVCHSLQSVLLWDELKDQLQKSAMSLSLEQKQRLCIARLVAVKPDVLLMDEPCSTLDPQSTAQIEELMRQLKQNYTIIIVTHSMQQAARISEHTGFMLLGELIEFGRTKELFTKPVDKRTEDYITGRYG